MSSEPLLPFSQPQMRPPGEDTWYCPARDITVLTPEIVRRALELVDCDKVGYRKWLDFVLKGSITDECLCQVASALGTLLSEEKLLGGESFDQAVLSSGLEGAPVGARLLVFSLIGEVLLCGYWDGIRVATVAKKGEELRIRQTDPKELVAEAARLARNLHRTPWQRKKYKVAAWIAGKLQAVHASLIGEKGDS
jgi:hypothetical protein